MHTLVTSQGDVRARFVVNAAGLHADTVDALFGPPAFTVQPRRGELIVFDKLARSLVRHILLPVPTAVSKGVLVSPTVLGNVVLGRPRRTSERSATGTTAAGLASLLARGRRILPALVDEEVTVAYAGLRAATESSDYRIRFEPSKAYALLPAASAHRPLASMVSPSTWRTASAETASTYGTRRFPTGPHGEHRRGVPRRTPPPMRSPPTEYGRIVATASA